MEISGSKYEPNTNNVYEPAPILSLADLVGIVDVIIANEQADKNQMNVLKNIDEVDIRRRVVEWAALGFPDAFVLYSFQFHKSERCSDGIVRNNVLDYYNFLFPTEPITTILATVQQRLPGMKLTYSYTDNFTICVHISKL